MKQFYCSQCHKELTVTRRALPKYATIVELVDPHTCLEVPVEFNFKPAEVPTKAKETDKQYLDNTFGPKGFGSVSTADLRDRRFEGDAESKTKTSAPGSILSMIDSMANTTPVKPLTDLPSEG